VSVLKKIGQLFSFRKKRDPFYEESSAALKAHNVRWSENGIFTYEEDGFMMECKDGPRKIKWKEIMKLVVYKPDTFYCKKICMDIILKDSDITISTETGGWFQFLIKSNIALRRIQRNWERKMNRQTTSGNFRVIYKRRP